VLMRSKHFAAAGKVMLVACLLVPVGAAAVKRTNQEEKPDQIRNRDVGRGVNFYSLEHEIALGRQLAQQVEQRVRLIDDPMITEYVNRVGQNLARNSGAKMQFTIKLVDTDKVNAVALPGGFLFVNSGLILLADNEAELAGVMAHEIAHVAARHATRQATRAEIADYIILPLAFMRNPAGPAIANATRALTPVILSKFSRAFEAEADMLGLQYLYRTGYDPEALIGFLENLECLEKTSPGALARLFSTHPMTADRVRAARLNIRNLAVRREYVLNTSEFIELKVRLIALQYARRPGSEQLARQGERTTTKGRN